MVCGKVVRKIKGGLLVDIGVPVFLPASQVDIRRPPISASSSARRSGPRSSRSTRPGAISSSAVKLIEDERGEHGSGCLPPSRKASTSAQAGGIASAPMRCSASRCVTSAPRVAVEETFPAPFAGDSRAARVAACQSWGLPPPATVHRGPCPDRIWPRRAGAAPRHDTQTPLRA